MQSFNGAALCANEGKTRHVYTRLKPPEKDMGSAEIECNSLQMKYSDTFCVQSQAVSSP